MHILMISRDKKVLDKNSAVAARMVKYGRLCDQLTIIVFTVGRGEKVQLADNVWVHPTNSFSRFFCFWDAYKKVKSQKSKVKSFGSEAANYLITVQDPFETALAGWLIKKKNDWPLQIQIHTDFLSPHFAQESCLNKIRVWLAKWLLKKADGIRVVSQRIKNSLVDQLKIIEEKICVLPIYVDANKISSYQPKIDLHQKYQTDFVILTMARLTKEKNVGLLINAFGELAQEYPKARLVIVGDGPGQSNLQLQATSYKLQANVVFEDWTDDPVSYYKTADLFVLTSNYEGYAMSAVEAMAAGCLVIMTDVGCAGEVIKDNENGLVVPVGSKEKLIEAIREMIKNSDLPSESEGLRQKLIAGGLKTASQLMAEEEYLNRYKEGWERLLFERSVN